MTNGAGRRPLEAESPTAPPERPATVGPAWPLDTAMAETAGGPPWGWRPVAAPIVTFVVVVVVAQMLVHTLHPASGAARLWASALVNGGAQVVLAAGVWWGGREVAAAAGGWGVFGWRRPRRQDVGAAAVGILAAFSGRYAVNVVMGAATHGNAVRDAQNVHLDHFSWPGAIILVVSVVVLAPVLEELTFRGLLLRTFMRRWSFWPAAITSTAVFAVFHTYEAASVVGAVTLALSVACIGATNCVLVRYTDRLAAGVGVHAVLNGIAAAVLLTIAAR